MNEIQLRSIVAAIILNQSCVVNEGMMHNSIDMAENLINEVIKRDNETQAFGGLHKDV